MDIYFALKSAKRFASMLEFTGLALIVASTLWIDAAMRWPGWLALLPVAGAVLILVAARDNSRVTNNKFAQYLGATSYSLYLWHWPVVVGLNLMGVTHSALWIVAGIALSLLLAHLSYRFVEQYWRGPAGRPHPFRPLSIYASVLMVITGAGLFIFRYEGIPMRMDSYVATADGEQKNRNPRTECFVVPGSNPTSPMCVFGKNTEKVAVIVIGDSHSNATINAIAESIPPELGGALFLGADGCISPVNISMPKFTHCGSYNQKTIDYLQNNYPGVPVVVVNHLTEKLLNPGVIAENRAIYLDGKPNTHKDFALSFLEHYTHNICGIAASRKVFIVQPIPEMGVNVPQIIARAKLYEAREIEVTITRAVYDKENALVRDLHAHAAKVCGAEMLDPIEYLCDATNCFGSIKHRPLYYDDDHLSEYGNRFLTPMFSKIWSGPIVGDVSMK